jgi:hypothetical protein
MTREKFSNIKAEAFLLFILVVTDQTVKSQAANH